MKNTLMKKLFVVLIAMSFFSCKKESENAIDVSNIKAPIKVERLDQLFFNAKPADLPNFKRDFSDLFPIEETDSVWVDFMTDSLFIEVSKEVKMKYPDNIELEKGISDLVKHVKYYFPTSQTPRVITLVNRVDIDSKAIYSDKNNIILIGLDCYLGQNHRYYEPFAEYQRVGLNQDQILPDLAESFAYSKIPNPSDNRLISIMINFGKLHYLKDILLPDVAEHTKIRYTKEQLAWCKENEYQMWTYFVEKNLLYNTDVKNQFNFINDAPFSKFYLEVDTESPGRIGQWIGLQIVKSYMENNNVSLDDLLTTNAATIFEKSKYKPKK
jgi:gliding motility-associated lipoprotein GldB